MLKDVGDNPSTEKVREYVWNTLSGGVSTMQGFLPLYFLVYGHWLFTILIMSKKNNQNGCLIQLIDTLYKLHVATLFFFPFFLNNSKLCLVLDMQF